MIRRLFGAAAAAALLVSMAASAVAAGGPPSLAFYVDDVRYRTVGTPTDFSGTGGTGPLVRSDLRPGRRPRQRGRGEAGRPRLQRRPLDGPPGDVGCRHHADPADEREQVVAYAAAGMLTIASAPVKLFECPVIPVGGR